MGFNNCNSIESLVIKPKGYASYVIFFVLNDFYFGSANPVVTSDAAGHRTKTIHHNVLSFLSAEITLGCSQKYPHRQY